MFRLCRSADLSISRRISLQEESCRPRFHAVRRDGDDRNFELIVREFEMVPERPIWLQLNGSASNSDLCLRIRAAVEDHLRIHVHEKVAFWLAKRLAAPACSDSAEKTALGNQLVPTRKAEL